MPVRGIDVKIVQMLADELGIDQVEFVECPFARCLKKLETGMADMMTGLFKSEQRAQYISFAEPSYLRDPPKVFYLRKSQPDIKSYQDLYPLTVGVVRDTVYFPQFDQDLDITKIPLVTDTQLINMLLKGRIDTFVGTESTFDYLLSRQQKMDQLKKASYRFASPRHSYFGISKKSWLNDEMATVNQTVSRLLAQNAFVKVVDDWFKQALNAERLAKQVVNVCNVETQSGRLEEDITVMVLDRLNANYHIRYLPSLEQCLEQLRLGEIDLVPGITEENLPEGMSDLLVYRYEQPYLLLSRGMESDIASLGAIAQSRLGVAENSAFDGIGDERVDSYKDSEELFAALVSDQLDFALVDTDFVYQMQIAQPDLLENILITNWIPANAKKVGFAINSDSWFSANNFTLYQVIDFLRNEKAVLQIEAINKRL